MSKENIEIRVHTRRFTSVPNDLVNNPKLSLKEKGIMLYLLSKPDGWRVRIKDIMNHCTDGKDAIYSGLHKLKLAGYIVHEVIRNEKGQIEAHVYHVYEEPQNKKNISPTTTPNQSDGLVSPSAPYSTERKNNCISPQPENPEVDSSLLTEKPDMEKPDTENPEVDLYIYNKDVSNTDYSKTNSSKSKTENFEKFPETKPQEPDQPGNENNETKETKNENDQNEHYDQNNKKPDQTIISTNQISNQISSQISDDDESWMDDKFEYTDKVFLSFNELMRLNAEYGEGLVEKTIQSMSNYKLQHNKIYHSDFAALRNWMNKDRSHYGQ